MQGIVHQRESDRRDEERLFLAAGTACAKLRNTATEDAIRTLSLEPSCGEWVLFCFVFPSLANED